MFNSQCLNHLSGKSSDWRCRWADIWLLLSQSGRGGKVLSLLAGFSGAAYFAYVKGVSWLLRPLLCKSTTFLYLVLTCKCQVGLFFYHFSIFEAVETSEVTKTTKKTQQNPTFEQFHYFPLGSYNKVTGEEGTFRSTSFVPYIWWKGWQWGHVGQKRPQNNNNKKKSWGRFTSVPGNTGKLWRWLFMLPCAVKCVKKYFKCWRVWQFG